jgi:manganese transport protein
LAINASSDDRINRVSETKTRSSMSDRTAAAISDRLAGRGGRNPLIFAGPAVVASIAYMDPGNFATNIQAGAGYGYTLLWVVVMASAIAMLFQALSAKLGIVTGRNLAELCRDELPRTLTIPMWIISEIAAMATDLAEFLGGAIGLSLLGHIPLFAGMVITGIITYAILLLDRRGFRPMEIVIGALVAVISLCYLTEVLIAPVAWGQAALHAALPIIPDAAALTIAVGIVGATVMPHALYLHSGLTGARVAPRNPAERRLLLRFSNWEVLIALGLAGLVNMAMVVMAAGAFHHGHSNVADIDVAYHTLTPLLGAGAAAIFLVSLLASGISSSVVGTLAGQMIMQGFVGFAIPVWLRRVLTMIPAFIVVGLGVNPTRALILSQVVLSLALPIPMLALVWFTRSHKLMGVHANQGLTQFGAAAGAAIILMLNIILIAQTFGIPIPLLG